MAARTMPLCACVLYYVMSEIMGARVSLGGLTRLLLLFWWRSDAPFWPRGNPSAISEEASQQRRRVHINFRCRLALESARPQWRWRETAGEDPPHTRIIFTRTNTNWGCEREI